LLRLLAAGFGPKANPAHVRLHVSYWEDERNRYKWDQSVAVDQDPNRPSISEVDHFAGPLANGAATGAGFVTP